MVPNFKGIMVLNFRVIRGFHRSSKANSLNQARLQGHPPAVRVQVPAPGDLFHEKTN